MEERTIIVTGIGGNVGQGIIRNLRALNLPLVIIGTNTKEESAGNHLVDYFHKVPFGNEESYVNVISDIIKKYGVELIIPATDFEVENLSRNSKELNAKLAVSSAIATRVYLDKYESYLTHKKANLPFAKSYLPSEYVDQFQNAIAKPRKGRGSRGIMKNFVGQVELIDDEYVIQEMHMGIELTTAVYASYISGKFIGQLTFERTLENGATTYCKVLKDFDKEFSELSRQIVALTDMRGAFNIQSILTKDGDIVPFEVNCRISGTNSIRTHFGFEDVRYTIEELLFNLETIDIQTKEGVAFRYLSDVIYINGMSTYDNKDNFKLF